MLNGSSSSIGNALSSPFGNVLKTSVEGNEQRKYYKALTLSGITYKIEDSVLIVDVSKKMKPFVAIIRDIFEMKDGKLWLNVQWFYRPEDIENKVKNVETIGARELFYSFHKKDVPAEWIAHKCIVHFITTDIDIPNRKKHPGFIVRKMYDPNSRRLLNLNEEIYIQYLKDEINHLIEKSMRRLGITCDSLGRNHAAAADKEVTKE
ncbi:protein REPRESSOR OF VERNALIZATION 1-like [Rutidosis leptorrhynchoides]|uniref:protein REPRESSOR OF VERNALIZATION 1-like n=1 Tax=Rutidosis leptorrhynchoides TaxID=125765 RepID=UPI003A9976D0